MFWVFLLIQMSFQSPHHHIVEKSLSLNRGQPISFKIVNNSSHYSEHFYMLQPRVYFYSLVTHRGLEWKHWYYQRASFGFLVWNIRGIYPQDFGHNIISAAKKAYTAFLKKNNSRHFILNIKLHWTPVFKKIRKWPDQFLVALLHYHVHYSLPWV